MQLIMVRKYKNVDRPIVGKSYNDWQMEIYARWRMNPQHLQNSLPDCESLSNGMSSLIDYSVKMFYLDSLMSLLGFESLLLFF